jgi:hypothetical protein
MASPSLKGSLQALRPAHGCELALGSSQLSSACFLRLEDRASRLHAPGRG